MTQINSVKSLEDKEFEQPDGIVQATVCSNTGLKAGYGCPAVTEIMAADKVPSETCTQCQTIAVCTVCGGIATENSPGTGGQAIFRLTPVPASLRPRPRQ